MKLIEGICEYFYDLFKACLVSYFEDGALPIEYEKSQVINHKIYNAEWSLPLNDFKINVLFAELSEGEHKNWILMLENSEIVFVFKYLDGEYQILDKNNNKVTLEVLGNLISSFEKMINVGFSWKPKKLNKNLFEILKKLI